MTRSFSIPSWAPAMAALAIVAWAVSIWWMVATLPDGTQRDDDTLSLVGTEVESLSGRVEALAIEIEDLREERGALAARIDDLEARAAAAAVAPVAAIDGDNSTTETTNGTAAESEFFTNGADRYNCRDFASMAEAQEALEANRPGDPNRIDMNGNGEACEDFTYRNGAIASVR